MFRSTRSPRVTEQRVKWPTILCSTSHADSVSLGRIMAERGEHRPAVRKCPGNRRRRKPLPCRGRGVEIRQCP